MSAETVSGGVDTAARTFGGRGANLRDWLRSNLFPETAAGPIGWRRVTLAFACVTAGAAISLSRTVGPGSLNTVWIEDAKYLLNQALNQPFYQTLGNPISSYYQEPARILTGLALLFPLAWVPGVMAVFAALQYAMYGLVAYVASGPHLKSPWLRLLIAAPACMIPLAYTQANNDLVTVQFFGLYGAFWVLLWRPGTQAGKICAPIVMATVSFTASLSLVLAPLVAVRLFADRSKTAASIAIAWLLGLLLEFSPELDGKVDKSHFAHRNSVLWLLNRYGARVVPRALFGEKALGGPGVSKTGTYSPLHITNMAGHIALITVAWVLVALVIAVALARFTNPNWPLVVTAAIFSGAIWFEELFENQDVVQSRYIIAPALLFYVFMVAAMRPRISLDMTRLRKALRFLPIATFTVLLAVAVTVNFRVVNGRTTDTPWTSVVATAHAACAEPGVQYYRWVNSWWWLSIPCDQFRDFWIEPGTTSGAGA